jgi:hypothetical protein
LIKAIFFRIIPVSAFSGIGQSRDSYGWKENTGTGKVAKESTCSVIASVLIESFERSDLCKAFLKGD